MKKAGGGAPGIGEWKERCAWRGVDRKPTEHVRVGDGKAEVRTSWEKDRWMARELVRERARERERERERERGMERITEDLWCLSPPVREPSL